MYLVLKMLEDYISILAFSSNREWILQRKITVTLSESTGITRQTMINVVAKTNKSRWKVIWAAFKITSAKGPRRDQLKWRWLKTCRRTNTEISTAALYHRNTLLLNVRRPWHASVSVCDTAYESCFYSQYIYYNWIGLKGWIDHICILFMDHICIYMYVYVY